MSEEKRKIDWDSDPTEDVHVRREIEMWMENPVKNADGWVGASEGWAGMSKKAWIEPFMTAIESAARAMIALSEENKQLEMRLEMMAKELDAGGDRFKEWLDTSVLEEIPEEEVIVEVKGRKMTIKEVRDLMAETKRLATERVLLTREKVAIEKMERTEGKEMTPEEMGDLLDWVKKEGEKKIREAGLEPGGKK